MQRWMQVALWAGLCLVLMLVVRGTLGHDPSASSLNRSSLADITPPAPPAYLAPPQTIAVRELPDGPYVAVVHESLWRLPPPYEGITRTTNAPPEEPPAHNDEVPREAPLAPDLALELPSIDRLPIVEVPPDIALHLEPATTIELQPTVPVLPPAPPQMQLRSTWAAQPVSPPPRMIQFPVGETTREGEQVPTFAIAPRIPLSDARQDTSGGEPPSQIVQRPTWSGQQSSGPQSSPSLVQSDLVGPTLTDDYTAAESATEPQQEALPVPDFVSPAPTARAPTPQAQPLEINALAPWTSEAPQDDFHPAYAAQGDREPPAEVSIPSPPAARPTVSAGPRLPDSVADKIQTLVDRGFRLGARGAYYSAREDFLEAIRLVAQSLDQASGSQDHIQSLARGMRALSEADDFQATSGRLDVAVDVVDRARGHKTVLAEPLREDMSPFAAMQRYYEYAEDQLARAGRTEPVASRAWYALAKLQPLLNQDEIASIAPAPRALAQHRVAIRICPDNHLAQHEVGVLLARYGQYADARQHLEQAVQAHPMPETWQNLAIVYHQLGWPDRSAVAEAASQQLADLDQTVANQVRLVDPNTFQEEAAPSNSSATASRKTSNTHGSRPAQR